MAYLSTDDEDRGGNRPTSFPTVRKGKLGVPKSANAGSDARLLPAPPACLSGQGALVSYLRECVWATRHLLVLLTVEIVVQGATASIVPTVTTNYFANLHNSTAIDCSVFGGSGPPLPQRCSDASGTASFVKALSGSIGAAIMFLTAPTLGALADTFGRRPFLILAQAAQALPSLALLAYELQPDMFPLTVYYVAGGLASALSTLTIIGAYIGDCVSPEYRAPAFGVILGVFGLGLVASQWLAVLLSTRLVFWVQGMAQVFNVLWVIAAVPETLLPAFRMPFKTEALNPLKCFSILLRSRMFVVLAAAVFFQSICANGVLGILVYYFQATLGWGTHQTAALFMLLGVSLLVVNIVFLRPLVWLFGYKGVVLVGFAAHIPAYIVLALVHKSTISLAMIAIAGVGDVVFPAVSAIKSINVDASHQGAIQGALFGVRSLGSTVGPLLFSALYKVFSSKDGALPYIPGMPFYVAAGCMFLAFLVSMTLPKVVVPKLREVVKEFHTRRRAWSNPLHLPSIASAESLSPSKRSPYGRQHQRSSHTPLLDPTSREAAQMYSPRVQHSMAARVAASPGRLLLDEQEADSTHSVGIDAGEPAEASTGRRSSVA